MTWCLNVLHSVHYLITTALLKASIHLSLNPPQMSVSVSTCKVQFDSCSKPHAPCVWKRGVGGGGMMEGEEDVEKGWLSSPFVPLSQPFLHWGKGWSEGRGRRGYRVIGYTKGEEGYRVENKCDFSNNNKNRRKKKRQWLLLSEACLSACSRGWVSQHCGMTLLLNVSCLCSLQIHRLSAQGRGMDRTRWIVQEISFCRK